LYPNLWDQYVSPIVRHIVVHSTPKVLQKILDHRISADDAGMHLRNTTNEEKFRMLLDKTEVGYWGLSEVLTCCATHSLTKLVEMLLPKCTKEMITVAAAAVAQSASLTYDDSLMGVMKDLIAAGADVKGLEITVKTIHPSLRGVRLAKAFRERFADGHLFEVDEVIFARIAPLEAIVMLFDEFSGLNLEPTVWLFLVAHRGNQFGPCHDTPDVIHFFHSRGGDVNATREGRVKPPIFKSLVKDDKAAVRAFLECGADVDFVLTLLVGWADNENGERELCRELGTRSVGQVLESLGALARMGKGSGQERRMAALKKALYKMVGFTANV
ncbi:hypothetical protein HK097_003411, partial [Rhizophlyctis rosea]